MSAEIVTSLPVNATATAKVAKIPATVEVTEVSSPSIEPATDALTSAPQEAEQPVIVLTHPEPAKKKVSAVKYKTDSQSQDIPSAPKNKVVVKKAKTTAPKKSSPSTETEKETPASKSDTTESASTPTVKKLAAKKTTSAAIKTGTAAAKSTGTKPKTAVTTGTAAAESTVPKKSSPLSTVQASDDTIAPISVPPAPQHKRTAWNAFLGRLSFTIGGEMAHNLIDDMHDVEHGRTDNVGDCDVGDDDDDDDDDDSRCVTGNQNRDFEKDDHTQDHNGSGNDASAHRGGNKQFGTFSEKALNSALNSQSKSPISFRKPQPGASQDEKAKADPTVEVHEVRRVSPDGSANPPVAVRTNIFYSTMWLNFSEYLIKTVNIFVCLVFFAHGIMHIMTVGQTVPSRLGDITDGLHSAAITMWSLAFAAIAGQALKAYATWKAERGIKLVSLEQLLHSQSFSSSIKQPLLLRRIDYYSVALFALWALSPLTNQAIQKMPLTVFNNITSSIDLSYVAVTSIDGIPSNQPQQYKIDVFEPLFGSALLTYGLSGNTARDGWQNPKAPVISTNVSDFESTTIGVGNWVDTSSWTNYASLIGIPVILPTNATDSTSIVQSILINSSYFDFDCSRPITSTPAAFNMTMPNGTAKFLPDAATTSQTLWLSYTNESMANATEPSSGIFEWASVKNFDQMEHSVCQGSDPNNCYRQWYPENNTEFVYSVCAVRSVGMQNNITCLGRFDCTVTSARIVTNAPFAHLPMSIDYVKDFAATNPGKLGNSITTISEAFLADPQSILGYLTGGNINKTGEALMNTDAASFSSAMRTMWNTYYSLYYGNNVYTEGILDNTAASGKGTRVSTVEVYTLSPGWTAIYWFSCFVLLALAIADIIWEAKTISPDFLGFASSIVRNNARLNKHFNVNSKGLTGIQKTRAMADMEVMIQDIKSTADVGKIALAPSEAGSVRLRRTRNYGT